MKNPLFTATDAEWQRMQDSADFYEACATSHAFVLLHRLMTAMQKLTRALADL